MWSNLLLRIPHSYDAKIAKICNLWTFWLYLSYPATWHGFENTKLVVSNIIRTPCFPAGADQIPSMPIKRMLGTFSQHQHWEELKGIDRHGSELIDIGINFTYYPLRSRWSRILIITLPKVTQILKHFWWWNCLRKIEVKLERWRWRD